VAVVGDDAGVVRRRDDQFHLGRRPVAPLTEAAGRPAVRGVGQPTPANPDPQRVRLAVEQPGELPDPVELVLAPEVRSRRRGLVIDGIEHVRAEQGPQQVDRLALTPVALVPRVLWLLGKNATLAEKFMKELPEQEQDWLLDMMRADVAAKAANPEADLGELASQTTSRWIGRSPGRDSRGWVRPGGGLQGQVLAVRGPQP
jgi:hypothetical protein